MDLSHRRSLKKIVQKDDVGHMSLLDLSLVSCAQCRVVMIRLPYPLPESVQRRGKRRLPMKATIL